MTAMREMYMSRGSVVRIWPKTERPKAAGSTLLRATASRVTAATSSLGVVSFRLPPKVPMAVRAPATRKMSVMSGAF